MKKKILLFALIMSAFVACKKEDELSIVGSWKLSSVTASEAIDMNEDNVYNTDVLKEIEGCFDFIYDFKSDGTFIATAKSSPESYQNGKWITDITKCETETVTGNWEIDETNTKLTMIVGTSSEKQNIQLTDKTLLVHDGFYYSNGSKTVYGNIKFIRQ